MTQIVNPSYELIVFGSDTFTTKDAVRDPYVDFNIEKDLDEDPNEAVIRLYNLNEGFRAALTDAAEISAPVQFFSTQSNSTDLVKAFTGEIDTCRHVFMHPGHETILSCISQQLNHRATFVEQMTFAKGTPVDEIVNALIDAVGLPRGVVDFDFIDDLGVPHRIDAGITLSQSLTGPAFPLLKRYCFDLGMYAYILDGTVNVSSVYTPTSPQVIEIPADALLEAPIPSSRTDAQAIEQKTIAESIGHDPFEKAKKKRKKKKKVKVPLNKGTSIYVTLPEPAPYSDDYTEYEAIDIQVKGMDFMCTLRPGIQPDNIVWTKALPKRLFRVIDLNHYGESETFSDWTTELKCDEYEDTTGELQAGIL
jgi:hypothetical protein